MGDVVCVLVCHDVQRLKCRSACRFQVCVPLGRIVVVLAGMFIYIRPGSLGCVFPPELHPARHWASPTKVPPGDGPLVARTSVARMVPLYGTTLQWNI